MRRLLLGVSIVAALAMAGAAVAASDLGAEREAHMKAIGGATGTVFNMIQGKTDYDAAAVKAAMDKIATAATEFPTLFPPGSEKADGRASPDIWTNKADFDAHAAKLASDAKAVAAAADGGAEAVKPLLMALGEGCATCHKLYRLGKD
jgi:cytochrome c556